MANKVILSKQYSLKIPDGIKSFIMAVGTPVLYALQELIPGWNAPPVVKIGVSAGITYLIKNYFAGPKVITTYKTNKKAEAVAEDIKEETK